MWKGFNFIYVTIVTVAIGITLHMYLWHHAVDHKVNYVLTEADENRENSSLTIEEDDIVTVKFSRDLMALDSYDASKLKLAGFHVSNIDLQQRTFVFQALRKGTSSLIFSGTYVCDKPHEWCPNSLHYSSFIIRVI